MTKQSYKCERLLQSPKGMPMAEDSFAMTIMNMTTIN
jgi:hypothetical protein